VKLVSVCLSVCPMHLAQKQCILVLWLLQSTNRQPASMGFSLYWQPAIVFFTLANKVHSFIIGSPMQEVEAAGQHGLMTTRSG